MKLKKNPEECMTTNYMICVYVRTYFQEVNIIIVFYSVLIYHGCACFESRSENRLSWKNFLL